MPSLRGLERSAALRRERYPSVFGQLLLSSGLTQHDIALKAQVSERTVWGLVHGRTRGTLPVRKRLLLACGISSWREVHAEIFGPLPHYPGRDAASRARSRAARAAGARPEPDPTTP